MIDPAFRALVYSAVYLGCRWGELVGLKKDNLNLLKREVRIVGSLEEVKGGPRYVEETKTSASRRTLSIPPFLAEELGLHLQGAPESDFVFTGASDSSPPLPSISAPNSSVAIPAPRPLAFAASTRFSGIPRIISGAGGFSG